MFFFLIGATFFGCTDLCRCPDQWENEITYHAGDIVQYHDTCWTASSQGRGIVPGPWQQNGNDIWLFDCVRK